MSETRRIKRADGTVAEIRLQPKRAASPRTPSDDTSTEELVERFLAAVRHQFRYRPPVRMEITPDNLGTTAGLFIKNDASRRDLSDCGYEIVRRIEAAGMETRPLEILLAELDLEHPVHPADAIMAAKQLLRAEESPPDDKAPTNKSRNPDRDDFIVKRRNEGATWNEIRAEVNTTAGWSRLGSEHAVRNAYNRRG